MYAVWFLPLCQEAGCAGAHQSSISNQVFFDIVQVAVDSDAVLHRCSVKTL
jgi:hypothetical protein